jgi:predicted site-specific integrase-resolvase
MSSKNLSSAPTMRLGYPIKLFCSGIGISRSSAYKLMRAGKLKSIRVAGRRIVPAAEAERIANEGAE